MDILWLSVRITFQLGLFALKFLYNVGLPIARYVGRNPHARKVALGGAGVVAVLWLAYTLINSLLNIVR